MTALQILLAAAISTAGLAHGAEPEAREFTAKNGIVVKYRWHEPAAGEGGKSHPLVLFLHGSGERGDDNRAQLKHGVGAIIAGAEKLDDPVFLIAPQCPAGQSWSPVDEGRMRLSAADKPNPLMEAVLELVDETLAKPAVDRSRFYVTGLSMGGFGTWDLLARVPEKIAAAMPICGGGDPALAERFAEVPIWAFHGVLDPAVPVSATKEMISALEKAGGKPGATFYPDADHDSWTRTYEDPKALRWLLAQRKK